MGRIVFAHDDRPVSSPAFRAVQGEPTIFFVLKPLQKFDTAQRFYEVRDRRRRSWPHLAVTVHHGGHSWLNLVIELACHSSCSFPGISSPMVPPRLQFSIPSLEPTSIPLNEGETAGSTGHPVAFIMWSCVKDGDPGEPEVACDSAGS